MTKDELTNWFWNKVFISCYALKLREEPDMIFWIYDEKLVRKFKLCKINNQKITLPKDFIGDFIFEQNIETKIIYFNVDYIYRFISNNYNIDNNITIDSTEELIEYILNTNKNNNRFWYHDVHMMHNYRFNLFMDKIRNNEKFKLYE